MSEQFEEEYCCLLKICCGGHHDRDAKQALANKLVAAVNLDPVLAGRVADWVQDTFDLAPAGSLKAYRDAVAGMAREYPYHEG